MLKRNLTFKISLIVLRNIIYYGIILIKGRNVTHTYTLAHTHNVFHCSMFNVTQCFSLFYKKVSSTNMQLYFWQQVDTGSNLNHVDINESDNILETFGAFFRSFV